MLMAHETHCMPCSRSSQTASTLLTFILAMKLYPEVQAKALAELDRVLGGRLPTAADKDSLPYLNAVLLETMRWHPAGPNCMQGHLLKSTRGTDIETPSPSCIAIPHKLKQDDVYNGYRIPAETVVIVNVW